MDLSISTIVLGLLTLLGVIASIVVVVHVCRSGEQKGVRQLQYSLFGVITLSSLLLFIYRLSVVHHGWRPLTSHVDGLIMLVTLLCPILLFLQQRGRIRGLAVVGFPLVTLMLAWATCSSRWTFYQFSPDTFWKAAHLISVYLGAISIVLGGMGGGTYLIVARKLRSKRRLATVTRFASLETIERLIVVSAMVGFSFLTLGLVTGFIEVSARHEQLTAGWWYGPKMVLSFLAWCLYALLLNVRHTTHFRGSRAAWLSLLGLLLMIAVFGATHRQPLVRPDSQEPKVVVTTVSVMQLTPSYTMLGGVD